MIFESILQRQLIQFTHFCVPHKRAMLHIKLRIIRFAYHKWYRITACTYIISMGVPELSMTSHIVRNTHSRIPGTFRHSSLMSYSQTVRWIHNMRVMITSHSIHQPHISAMTGGHSHSSDTAPKFNIICKL